MHRRKLRGAPLDLPSPEDDLCQISMQMDQSDIPFSRRLINEQATLPKVARFDGWVRADLRSDSPKAPRCLTAAKPPHSSHQLGMRGLEGSQQLLPAHTKEDIRRAYSHELQRQGNPTVLKRSREHNSKQEKRQSEQFGHNNEGKSSKLGVRMRLVQAFTYPIMSNELAEIKRMPDIGKIRHLINFKSRWQV